MSPRVVIRSKFASAKQTAKILGVSDSRRRQLIKILDSSTPYTAFFGAALGKKASPKAKCTFSGPAIRNPVTKSRSSKRSYASKKARRTRKTKPVR